MADAVAENGFSPSSVDNFVYAFDASKDWLASAGVRSSEVQRCRAQVESWPIELKRGAMDAASIAILEVASKRLSFDSPEVVNAMTATLGAITLTQTFSVTAAQMSALPPASKGYPHWIYVVYRMRDQSHVGRPAAIVKDAPGLLDPDVLREMILRVIATDTAPGSTSSVSKMLRSYGGAVIERGLRLEIDAMLEGRANADGASPRPRGG